MGATGQDEYMRAATSAVLLGTPFESLADWSVRTKTQEAAAKVVSLADARARLRPAAPIAER
jgi:hypothetical protein